MPKQEIFFEHQAAGKRVEVLKSYDNIYAHEAFRSMSHAAQRKLWEVLKPEDIYDAADLPAIDDTNGEAEAFLWEELLEQAREDGNQLSFFIVNEVIGQRTESLFVTPDWPSAEAFAKAQI